MVGNQCTGWNVSRLKNESTARVQVNLRGSYLMTKHALIEMEKRDYGRVLLPTSPCHGPLNPCGWFSCVQAGKHRVSLEVE